MQSTRSGDIPLSFGGSDGDKAKSANLNIYFLIMNVFNTENIVGAYRYTGSPNNDGYWATHGPHTDRPGCVP